MNNHRTFGDWYEDLLGAAAICSRDGVRLHVTGEFDRPYKPDLLRLFDVATFVQSSRLTMDLFDVGWGGTHHRNPALARIADPLRILTRHDANRTRITENEAWIPRHDIKWPNDFGEYVMLHWRADDSQYRYRNPDPLRDLSQAYAIEVVEALLKTGRRFIRYGHAGTVPLNLTHPEYGELFSDDVTDTIRLAAHAQAVIEITPSGPAALAIGFRVPLLRMNMREEYALPFGNEMVLQHADFPEGETVTKARARELGITFTMLSPEECIAAATRFLEGK